MQTALIYLRVSTDKQAEKGISIPTQKDKCLETMKTNYEFDENSDLYIDKGESARTMDRPALLDMLNRCKTDKNIGAVIAYDISRLARDRVDYAFIKHELRKHKIKIISATEPIDESPEGQIVEGVLSAVAEFSSTQNGRRVKFNMAQKVKDGWWATKAPYGYKNVQERVSTGKVKAWLEVNWDEAKWVTKLFELFGTGSFSTKSLAKHLEKEGFPVRKHKKSTGKLHASKVERILRDKIYIGIIEWGEITNLNGKHELSLDKQLFEKVQAILDARLGGGSRNRRLFSILKPISFCSECNSKMTVEEHTMKNETVVKYLRCLKAQHGERVNCSQKYGHENDYLEYFAKVFKLIQLPKSFVEKIRDRIRVLFSDEQKLYEKARADILDKIEDIKRRKKNLVLQLIDNSSNEQDIELFQSVKVELEQDEKRLNNDLLKTETQIASVIKTIEMTLSLAANCHYAYQKAEPELKALLARAFFKKLFIKDKQIVRAVLNEPLDYLCRKRLQRYPVFDLAATGVSIVPS